MYRNRIGQLQLIRLPERIAHLFSFIELHQNLLREKVQFLHETHIAVEHTRSLLLRDAVAIHNLPFRLIIIPDLHNFITLTQDSTWGGMLLLLVRWRIQILLQDLVQVLHTKNPFAHRRHHLYIEYLRVDIGRKLLLHQCNRRIDDAVRVLPPHKEEILTLLPVVDGLSRVNPVRVHHDIAGLRLAENVRQLHNMELPGGNDIAQNISRPDAGQLIRVAHQNQACTHRNRLQ